MKRGFGMVVFKVKERLSKRSHSSGQSMDKKDLLYRLFPGD
jgi:hypothetical protein